MPYFDEAFIQFFSDLEENNNREWFADNKQTYQEKVKEPFEKFVATLIDQVQVIDPQIVLTPKEAIFRIYRDVRFSKDKSPYKLQMSAIVSSGGRKGQHAGGLYLELNHKHARVYGGLYRPDKEALYRIREAIAEHPATFRKLIEAPDFIKHFGEIRGEKNKRLPTEFRDAATVEPLIYNKSFYYFSDLPATDLVTDKLLYKIVELYVIGKPVGDFLRAAVQHS